MKIVLQCETCGKSFQVSPSRAKARFCSSVCYGKWMSTLKGKDTPRWGGGKITLACRECNQMYKRYPACVEGSHFCSRECCDKWKKKNLRGKDHPNWKERITRICKQCKQPFDVRPHAGGGTFCSLKCYEQWCTDRRITVICEQCGTSIQLQLHAYHGEGRVHFCSRRCLALWRTGERAANWQGGKSFEPYPLEFSGAFKEAVRSRDKHTCAICHLPGKDVHHINYNKAHTTMENCITLCVRCHRVTNGNRDYWQGVLQELMKARRSLVDSTWASFELEGDDLGRLAQALLA